MYFPNNRIRKKKTHEKDFFFKLIFKCTKDVSVNASQLLEFSFFFVDIKRLKNFTEEASGIKSFYCHMQL